MDEIHRVGRLNKAVCLPLGWVGFLLSAEHLHRTRRLNRRGFLRNEELGHWSF